MGSERSKFRPQTTSVWTRPPFSSPTGRRHVSPLRGRHRGFYRTPERTADVPPLPLPPFPAPRCPSRTDPPRYTRHEVTGLESVHRGRAHVASSGPRVASHSGSRGRTHLAPVAPGTVGDTDDGTSNVRSACPGRLRLPPRLPHARKRRKEVSIAFAVVKSPHGGRRVLVSSVVVTGLAL